MQYWVSVLLAVYGAALVAASRMFGLESILLFLRLMTDVKYSHLRLVCRPLRLSSFAPAPRPPRFGGCHSAVMFRPKHRRPPRGSSPARNFRRGGLDRGPDPSRRHRRAVRYRADDGVCVAEHDSRHPGGAVTRRGDL